MADLVPVRLSLLAEMLERAEQLGNGAAPERWLVELYAAAVALLEQRHPDDLPAPLADRVRFDALRHRALELAEENAALDAEVSQLVEDSFELHDQLWHLHERTSRLKVQLGRREQVKLRPERPLTIGLGGSGKRRQDTADRLLADQRRVELDLLLATELFDRSEMLIEARRLETDWGGTARLVVLAHGLADRELAHPDLAERPVPREQLLSALQYRVFSLAESIRILVIRRTALRIDNQGMRLRLAELQRELAALEQEQADRQVADPRARRRGWIGRLFRPGHE